MNWGGSDWERGLDEPGTVMQGPGCCTNSWRTCDRDFCVKLTEADCTHGADCLVHPNADGVHNCDADCGWLTAHGPHTYWLWSKYATIKRRCGGNL